MVEQLLIDYTDPDVVKRQNVHPNAGCEIDGQFVDIRNLLHIVAELEAENERLTKERDDLEVKAIAMFWKLPDDAKVGDLQSLAVKATESLSRTGAVKDAEAARITEERLSSLLARIHRDGGHYEAEHGTEKAWADADAIVASIYADSTHPAHSPAVFEPTPPEAGALKNEQSAPEGQQPVAYRVHAPADEHYGIGPDRLQFHPLAQYDLDNGYRQTPLYTRPSEQAVTEAMVERAFRDGIKYATICKVSDIDEAWRTSAVRADLKAAMEAGR
jgi:hypothetical protein